MAKLVSRDDFFMTSEDRLYYTLLTLSGEFTVKVLLDVRRELFDMMEISMSNIIFDLQKCDHMDSSAIGLLANLHKTLTKENFILGILSPSNKIMPVLDSTRLLNLIPLFQSHKEVEEYFD
ncbi:MAG: STAS domain-containing protein [Fibrobacteria bacterium]|nr:STAS domain-containing protein [Fibrobacteria bacterium]